MYPSLVSAQSTGFHLVPCGRSDQVGTVDESCQLGHLFVLIIRAINYLISMAAIVAMYYIVTAGFTLITALGEPEKIETGKKTITHSVVGFSIIILAFVFVNLLVNGIFGKAGAERKWWDINCLYDISQTGECPVRPIAVAPPAPSPTPTPTPGPTPANQVAAAIFSPNGGTFSGPGSITLTSPTPGAKIAVTSPRGGEINLVDDLPNTDFKNLLNNSPYTFNLSSSGSTEFRARAYKDGMQASPISSATFVVNPSVSPNTVAAVTFAPNGGTHSSAQTVTLTTATAGASIRYTLNGSDPTNSSPAYSTPITINQTTTVKAKAFKSGMTDSFVTSATFTIGTSSTAGIPPPGIKPWSGEDPLALVWGPKETELKAALTTFSSKWGNPVKAVSAYRPPAYTDHMRSIWEAYQFIQGNAAKANQGDKCSGAIHVTQVQVAGYNQAQKDWVIAEAGKHAFVGQDRTPPSCRSDHENGTTMDIYPTSGSFPTGAEYSRYIKAGFDAGLCHNIAGDEPHFILRAGSGLSDQQCLMDYVAPSTPSPTGAAPANVRLSPASATAGVFDKLVNAEATFKNNNVTLTITGQNLEGTIITTNATDISGGTGLVITAVRMISDTATDDKVEADLSVAPGTKDGQIVFAIRNKHGKNATVNFNIQLSGTQWLQRQFPKNQKRMTFFGHWSDIAPNERVQKVAAEITRGQQVTSSSPYKKLDIWTNIYEQSLWQQVKKGVCSTEFAAGCAAWRGNVIDNSEEGGASGLAGTILHESAHKLHAYYRGIYSIVNPFASDFPSKWVSAVGTISNCAYLPLKDLVTWKDGTWDTAHCGFIKAYGASQTQESYISQTLCHLHGMCHPEDISTMTEAVSFNSQVFNNSEVKTDSRYRQKLNLLVQYGFISSSPLGMRSSVMVGLTEYPESAIFIRPIMDNRRKP